MAVSKRKRNKPCKPPGVNSRGEHGAKKFPLGYLEKVLIGKGAFASLRSVDCTPWRGAQAPGKPVFDAEQVELNKRLYPHLFRGDR